MKLSYEQEMSCLTNLDISDADPDFLPCIKADHHQRLGQRFRLEALPGSRTHPHRQP
jgi:hypothetical protein